MMKDVTLVIPGRNCANTIKQCLGSVLPLLGGPLLKEILFVDDGSTDATASIVTSYPVTVIKGEGRGPAAARNLGLEAATTDLVWFIDSDCVAAPDALKILHQHLKESDIAGVGGSYLNMNTDSTLSCLIHEEIVSRHLRMPEYVNFLASFNILFRKQVLQELGGFDEKFLKAQDAELSYRVREAGYRMKFDMGSHVGHFHATRLNSYLTTQFHQGYWRVWLYLAYPDRATGDSYSNFSDHIQPVLTGLALTTLPFALVSPQLWAIFSLLNLLALAAALPSTITLLRRMESPKYLYFLPMSLIRAYARAGGMTIGLIRSAGYLIQNKEDSSESVDARTR